MKLGIGLPVDGYTQEGRDCVSALQADVVVLLNAHNVDDARLIVAGNPNATIIVRLDTPLQNEKPDDYINRVRPHVDPYYHQGFPLLYFIIGNEPDTGGVDVPVAYDLNTWFGVIGFYVHAFRDAFPGAALLSTPFTTEGSSNVTPAYLNLFDAIAMHSYWQVEGDIYNQMFGASWRYALGTAKPIFVTEVNNSAGTDVDQIVKWVQSAEDGVMGMALFIADARPPFEQMNVTADQCRAIRARYHAAQEPNMRDITYQPISYQDYRDAVIGGSYGRTDSHLLNEDAWRGLDAESRAFNLNPRLALAFAQVETHMGIDEDRGDMNQYGGIKFEGQAGAWDSKVTADTGGTYAAYDTAQAYFHDFYVQLHNEYLGPFLASGDLIGLVEKYTNGPGTGHNKLEQYDYFVAKYPPAQEPTTVTPLPNPDPSNPTPLPSDFPNGVTDAIPDLGRRMAELAMSWTGETTMGPGQRIDDGNGFVHAVADWCEAGAETVAAVITGFRLRFPSAWAHRQALEEAGQIDPNPNTAKVGDFDFWGPYSDGYGHITVRGTDGLTYGTSVVPNEWLGRPVDYYPNYAGHATPEAVLLAAKNLASTPADPMNPLGVVDAENNFRRFLSLRPQFDGYAPQIGNAIKHFWDANGPQLGVIRYGYPIPLFDGTNWNDENTMMRDNGTTIVSQMFERARLEFHPEAGNAVMIGRLGAEWLKYWQDNGSNIPTVEPNTDNVDPQFVEYWNSHGALETIGLPMTEKTQLPGSSFQAQVFERAILEYHPESADWPVQARRIGADWVQAYNNQRNNGGPPPPAISS